MKEESRWKNMENIYEIIEDEYFDDSKVKSPKEFLTKCISEYNVPRFIPLEVKKKIQQVVIEYGLFLHIVDFRRELVVLIHISSKGKHQKTQN